MQEFRLGQRVRLLMDVMAYPNHEFKCGESGTIFDEVGGKPQVCFDIRPDVPLMIDSSMLELIPESQAKTFEEFVFRYLGRDLAYCEKYSTYGLSFARAAWDAGVASTERRKYRFAALTDREGNELSYPGYRRMPIINGEDITFPAMAGDNIEAQVGFSYDEVGPIRLIEGWVRTMDTGDTITINRPLQSEPPAWCQSEWGSD